MFKFIFAMENNHNDRQTRTTENGRGQHSSHAAEAEGCCKKKKKKKLLQEKDEPVQKNEL